MGLTSLVNLNRCGVYSYWTNIWESKALYSRFYIYSMFVYFFFNFFNDTDLVTKFIYISKIRKRKNIKKFLLGRIWLLKYQNFYIINIMVLKNLELLKKNKKFVFKNLYFFYPNNTNYLNYKNIL